MFNPLSRREVLRFGAFTTVGGVLTPGYLSGPGHRHGRQGYRRPRHPAHGRGHRHPGLRCPAREGRPLPIVVVISGFTGNNEQNKDVVRRFAQAGFYAIAPELYHREGGMQGKNFQEMGQISGKVTRAQYLGDIRAAADYAKQQPWAQADRLGVTGFCGGGALTLHFAAEYPGVAAAVPWYGHVKRTFSDAPGVDAFSLADKLTMPVLGLYGEADPGIPADDVRRFEAELKKRNPADQFVLYPGAPHAFFSDDRPQVYKKDAAEDGWKRCVSFFDKYLKA